MYRLTAAEQQVVGLAYIMALVQVAVAQDAKTLQLLDGSYVKPAIVGRAEIATHAVGGAAHRYLYIPDKGWVLATRGMTQKKCQEGFGSDQLLSCLVDSKYYPSLHWMHTHYAFNVLSHLMQLSGLSFLLNFVTSLL
jgi:hypothetical protein